MKVFVSTTLTVILKALFYGFLKVHVLVFIFSVDPLMTHFSVLVYNFTYDNTLSAFAKRIYKSVSIFDRDILNNVDWFNVNKVIANPDKFHALSIYIKSKTIYKKAIINRYAKYKRVIFC